MDTQSFTLKQYERGVFLKNLLIKGGRIIDPANGIDKIADILVSEGKIQAIGELSCDDADIIDASGNIVLPGLIDIHVHFRDPGLTHKEDIESGSKAAVAGGFTTVCPMPNTAPTTDSVELIRYAIDKGREVGLCNILPIGAISLGLKGENLAPIADMAEAGAVAFSDDGLTTADSALMQQGLAAANAAKRPIFSHCEDLRLTKGGVMNRGKAAERFGLPGIGHEVEDIIIGRDIILANSVGARLHICHITTDGGVQLLREAKARGEKVTGEVCPHHFILSDEDMLSADPNFKMNPPLRTAADIAAIKQGLKDGTIDIIATDHAPHTGEEKACGFLEAPFGIIGLEDAFALSYTELVQTGILSLCELVEKMTCGPAKIIQHEGGTLSLGKSADIAIISLQEYTIDPSKYHGRSKNTPFSGRKVCGKVVYTIFEGRVVYS